VPFRYNTGSDTHAIQQGSFFIFIARSMDEHSNALPILKFESLLGPALTRHFLTPGTSPLTPEGVRVGVIISRYRDEEYIVLPTRETIAFKHSRVFFSPFFGSQSSQHAGPNVE